MARQGDYNYLVINESVTEDSGVYVANASNSDGEAKSYSKLSVQQKQQTSSNNETTGSTLRSINVESVSAGSGTGRPNAQAPEFKKLFYDTNVSLGENVRLETIILGSPKPKVIMLFKFVI